MWRGKLSPRKVDVLIRGLPIDSATRTALNGGNPLWSHTDAMIADLIDATQAVGWYVANKDVPTSAQGKFPEPYPRPGMEKSGRKARITAEDLIAFRERTKG